MPLNDENNQGETPNYFNLLRIKNRYICARNFTLFSMQKNTYTDLVKQTFDFPQEGFQVKENFLQFNGVDIKKLIDKYGTPFKLTYLPKIGMQINKAKKNVH